jgi:type II secretory pathway pseudopilin PulG
MTSGMQKVFLVLTAVMLVGIVLAGLVFTKAFSAWVAATRAGNESATIQNLKTFAIVESQYFYSHQRTFGTLEQMVQEELLSSKFKSNPVDGYVLTLTVTSDRAAYMLTADPSSAPDGKNHFYLDSVSRQIHFNPNQAAGPNDPILSK